MTLTAKQLFPRSAFVGFDTMIDELDRISRNSGDTFPPHNILKTGEDQYLIELAVAGFAEDELEIEVKNRTLTIRGQIKDSDRDYIHKGISIGTIKGTSIPVTKYPSSTSCPFITANKNSTVNPTP